MIFLPKSQPAPSCLEIEKAKANGNHNCGDVLDRLRTDFKNKCYLCEEGYITAINTEHFIPHKGDKELRFNWDNLFFCCYHCNNTKSDRLDFLNCTIEADGVDTKIRYYLDSFPKENVIITALENDVRVNNTVHLLDQIYNGSTKLKKIGSENLHSKILSEINVFQELLTEYFDANLNDDERENRRTCILQHLQPSSHFTAFKKWIIRDNETFSNEFAQYIM